MHTETRFAVGLNISMLHVVSVTMTKNEQKSGGVVKETQKTLTKHTKKDFRMSALMEQIGKEEVRGGNDEGKGEEEEEAEKEASTQPGSRRQSGCSLGSHKPGLV